MTGCAVCPDGYTPDAERLPESISGKHDHSFVHPTVHLISYEPIRWAGNPYLMLCTEDVPPVDSQTMKKGSMFQAGKEYDFTPRPDSPFETFVNSWGDLFSFIGEVFNWVAEMYNGIKSTVCDWIAEQLDGWAGYITNMGMAWRMTALGMPPTLPTLDELESMGTDYLARTVKEQADAAAPNPPMTCRGSRNPWPTLRAGLRGTTATTASRARGSRRSTGICAHRVRTTSGNTYPRSSRLTPQSDHNAEAGG